MPLRPRLGMRLTTRCGIPAHNRMATFILSGVDSDFAHCRVFELYHCSCQLYQELRWQLYLPMCDWLYQSAWVSVQSLSKTNLAEGMQSMKHWMTHSADVGL